MNFLSWEIHIVKHTSCQKITANYKEQVSQVNNFSAFLYMEKSINQSVNLPDLFLDMTQTQLSDLQPLEKYTSNNEIPLHAYYGGYYKKAKNSKCGNNVEKLVHCWWKHKVHLL